MTSLRKNLSTPEHRAFWAGVEKSAAEVETWPAWKRAGINVAAVRETPREVPPMPDPPARPTRPLDELDLLARLEALAFVTRAQVGAGVPGAREAYARLRALVARLPGG